MVFFPWFFFQQLSTEVLNVQSTLNNTDVNKTSQVPAALGLIVYGQETDNICPSRSLHFSGEGDKDKAGEKQKKIRKIPDNNKYCVER